jgi:hypothetical protein
MDDIDNSERYRVINAMPNGTQIFSPGGGIYQPLNFPGPNMRAASVRMTLPMVGQQPPQASTSMQHQPPTPQ